MLPSKVKCSVRKTWIRLLKQDRYGKVPGQIWRLADSLIERGRSGPLPPRFVQDGQPIEGDDKLADVMNRHYITKIVKICQGIELVRLQRQWRQGFPPPSSP